jgi:hypothetical protein
VTLDEFRALKKGDRVIHAMTSSIGTVCVSDKHRTGTVVAIQWDGSTLPVTFNDRMTAWMHWTLESKE